MRTTLAYPFSPLLFNIGLEVQLTLIRPKKRKKNCIKIEKKAIKLSFFSNDIICRNSVSKEILGINNPIQQGHRLQSYTKVNYFLYTSNKQFDFEIKINTTYKSTPPKKKYLSINLTNFIQNLYAKTIEF